MKPAALGYRIPAMQNVAQRVKQGKDRTFTQTITRCRKSDERKRDHGGRMARQPARAPQSAPPLAVQATSSSAFFAALPPAAPSYLGT